MQASKDKLGDLITQAKQYRDDAKRKAKEAGDAISKAQEQGRGRRCKEEGPDCSHETDLGEYEPAGYHPREPGDPKKSKEPDDGLAALANSLHYKEVDGKARRIGISAGEFVVLDRTTIPTENNPAKWHGHVRTWEKLDTEMQNLFEENKFIDKKKKGKKINILKDNC